MAEQDKEQRPGNRPVESQERDPDAVEATRPLRRAISGPGAADFIASGAGEDLPGFSPGKGTSAARGESAITDTRNLVPRLGPDADGHPGDRAADEQRPGSATGTVGGGGFDAHNDSPVRATGVDDPTVDEGDNGGSGTKR